MENLQSNIKIDATKEIEAEEMTSAMKDVDEVVKENPGRQFDPNEMFFHIFLRISRMYFKNFYKKREDGFIADEEKKIGEADNNKMKNLLRDNMKKGLRTMQGSHERFLGISDYMLRHSVSKQDAAAQDYLDRVAVGIRMVVERIQNVDDFPKIAQMVEIFNSGALDDIFKKKEETVTEEDKEVYGSYDKPEEKSNEIPIYVGEDLKNKMEESGISPEGEANYIGEKGDAGTYDKPGDVDPESKIDEEFLKEPKGE